MIAAVYKKLVDIYGVLNERLGTGSEVGAGYATETDDQGNRVLKVVDAAPFAYDPFLEALKTETVASKKIAVKDLRFTEDIAANGSKTITVAPPAGKVWEIKFVGLNIVAATGATSGTHQVLFRYATNESFMTVLKGSTAYNKNLSTLYGYFGSTTDSPEPVEKNLQIEALKGLNVTYDVPLYFIYENKTDVAHSSQVYLYVIVDESDLL